MGSGYLSTEVLEEVTEVIKDIKGDFAEIGVYKASLFSRLVPIGLSQGKAIHGFDSFQGLSAPCDKDVGYERGDLSCGGLEAFRKIMDSHDIAREDYILHQGYIPKCFDAYSLTSVKFSLVYIDVDLFEPTIEAIEWSWNKLNVGGIVGFDDYFPNRKTLASPAIDDFIKAHKDELEVVSFSNSQIFLRKGEKR